MQEMRQTMMAAKTPDERAVLMNDHMKAMQDGMDMMSQMGGGMPMGGIGMKGMAEDGAAMPMNKGERSEHASMHQRMDMMHDDGPARRHAACRQVVSQFAARQPWACMARNQHRFGGPRA